MVALVVSVVIILVYVVLQTAPLQNRNDVLRHCPRRVGVSVTRTHAHTHTHNTFPLKIGGDNEGWEKGRRGTLRLLGGGMREESEENTKLSDR